MTIIDVDFEVFKELTARRRSEEMTENDVLREILNLSKPLLTSNLVALVHKSEQPWVLKGVPFPHGTQFRHTHKGQQFTAAIKNGAFVMNGKRFTSLSAAAKAITDNPRNGWFFWECQLPGCAEWKLADEMR